MPTPSTAVLVHLAQVEPTISPGMFADLPLQARLAIGATVLVGGWVLAR